jgi:hypothetical protein
MRKFWTDQEKKWLKANYANTPTYKICQDLERSKCAVFDMANLLKLKKSNAYLQSPFSGRIAPGVKLGGGTFFKKGHVPFNKGKKQIEFMSRAAIAKTKRTQFKKGHKPHNTKEKDGIVVIRDNKTKPYQYVRIRVGHWRMLHRVLWEQHYGPIPAGHNIQFKDKNTLNCTIDNLYMVDRHNQMLENTIHRYPAEVKATMHQLKKLKRKIKMYEKQD